MTDPIAGRVRDIPASGLPLSVVVCTLNEEAVIERCLRSVSWAGELLVVDSGSTDGTRALAERLGARVIEHEWLGFSAQKNLAARAATNDWVLSLDADEIVSPRLGASIRDALASSPSPSDGFAFRRRHDFLGRLLPPNERRPVVRLYNRQRSAWDESMGVHEVIRAPGRTIELPGVLAQWNGYTLDELVVLFNRYATAEAAELRRRGARGNALKVVGRPIARFGWHYVIKGEFRLGGRGLLHAGLRATSDFLRYAKLYEAEMDARPGPEPHR